MNAKRQFISFERILVAGTKNFLRNAWLSVAATAVMVVALTIILLAIVLNITARNAITELSKNLKTSIYLREGTPPERRLALQNHLRANDNVSEVTFISTQEALQKFSAGFQNDPKLLEGLALAGGDTLPASLEVSVRDLGRLSEIEQIAKAEEYKDIIDSITLGKTDARKTIDRAADAQNFITLASVISASVFAAVSVLIIFNTIRMAIFTRSEEIRIMKLIGATPGYIRGPFVVEASMYGAIAGFIAIAAVYSMVVSIGSKLSNQQEFSQTYEFLTSTTTVVLLLFGAITAGILIGVLSSSLAMEKHLKLKHW